MTYTKHIFLFLFIFLSYSLHSQDPVSQNIPVITISPTYNNTPTFNPEIHPHIAVHPNIIIQNSSHINLQHITTISIQCLQKIKEILTKENYDTYKNVITQLLWKHSYSIVFASILGSYSIASLLLFIDYYHYLQKNTLWSRWKEEYTFEQLCTMSQKELTQELLTTINTQHYNKNDPTNFSHPLTLFLTDIEKEINICKRYILIGQTIKKLHLMKIFPITETKLNEVHKLAERAFFIKHLFLSWLSEYNYYSFKHY